RCPIQTGQWQVGRINGKSADFRDPPRPDNLCTRMRKLILIKHAKPLVDPAKPSQLWSLSDDGRQQARALAGQVAPLEPAIIISSDEPKAIETAQILADELKLPTEAAPDLHEHDRSTVPNMRSVECIPQ